MDTPLLAAEDEPPEPFLSLGTQGGDDETEFARLIAQSAGPLEALAQRFDISSSLNTRRAHRIRQRQRHHQPFHYPSDGEADLTRRVTDLQLTKRGPWTIVAVATLSILHLAFVWSSYMSDKWTETHLMVWLSWGQTTKDSSTIAENMFGSTTDTLIRSSNLASFLQQLSEESSYLLLMLLWAAALFVPCCFMICSSMWVVTDYCHPFCWEKRVQGLEGRTTIELSVRLGLAVLYVFVLLDIATSFLKFEWTDTSIQVRKRVVDGLASFVVGIACGLAAVFSFRAPPQIVPEESPVEESLVQPLQVQERPLGIRSPPPSAFRFPFHRPNNDEEEGPNIVLLEEEPRQQQQQQLQLQPGSPIPMPPPSGSSTPDLIDEDDSVALAALSQKILSFRKKVAVFQTGLFSVILLCPSFYIPIISFSYTGLASAVMTEPSVELFLWELPVFFWRQGQSAHTDNWIVALFALLLIATLMVLPVLATCLGIFTWLGDGAWSTQSRYILYCVQPALGGPVLAATLLAIYSEKAKPLNELVLQGISSSLCEKFAETMGDNCLVLSSRLLPGAWFFMSQSLLLEIFVMLTVRWSGLRQQQS